MSGVTGGRPAPPPRDPTRPICPACGAPGRDRRYHIEQYDLHRCRACGTEFLVLDPGRDQTPYTYWDSYKFEIYGDEHVRRDYEERYRTVLDRARRHADPLERAVDVGCGIGNFLDWLRDQGMDAVGADVDDGALAAAHERGLRAVALEDLADTVGTGQADLLTLWDVIEHIQDPGAALRDLVPLLRPGGIMVLETPDVRFPVRPAVIAIRKVVEPIRWSDMLYYADHQTYFSVEGLTRLLRSTGLEVVEHLALRSPNSKMQRQMELWAERGSGAGRLGPVLYGPFDRAMARFGIANKMVLIARMPTT